MSDDDERGPRASPFTLRLVDGERVRIDHPEFALLPPGLEVVDLPDDPRFAMN